MTEYLLIACLLLPFAGAVILAIPAGEWGKQSRYIASVAILLELLVVVYLWYGGGSVDRGPQWSWSREWIAVWGSQFHIGVDGLNLPFIAVTVVALLAILLFSRPVVGDRSRGLFAALLVACSAIIGMLMALDLLLFYFFWECSLLPLWILASGWGGRRYPGAAIRFALHALSGSFFLLVGIVYLACLHREAFGVISFSLEDMSALEIPLDIQRWLALAFFLGFAFRLPLVPFHSWLTGLQVRLPAGGRALLAGCWLSLGGYGLLRLCLPLFPDALRQLQGPFSWLAVAGAIYGALLLFVQGDIRRLVAFFSIAQISLAVFGIASLEEEGMAGGLLLLLSHGLIATGMLLLGEYQTSGQMGGEAAGGKVRFRLFGMSRGYMAIFFLAGMLLPGLSSFGGALMILKAAFADSSYRSLGAVAGMLLLALGLVRFWRSIVWVDDGGGDEEGWSRGKGIALALLSICILGLGAYPRLAVEGAEIAMVRSLERLERVDTEVPAADPGGEEESPEERSPEGEGE